jgi:hypothetical protein
VVVIAFFTDMLVIPIPAVYWASLGACVTSISVLFSAYTVSLLIVTPYSRASFDPIECPGGLCWSVSTPQRSYSICHSY